MRAHSAKLSFYLNNLRLAGGAGGIRANPLTLDYVWFLLPTLFGIPFVIPPNNHEHGSHDHDVQSGHDIN